jgi:hypothetical protein
MAGGSGFRFFVLGAAASALAASALAASGLAAAAIAAGEPARIEARSADLLAVGLVHGDRMSIHLSRVIDNAPVRDAALTVVLRGATHPAVAEADGSYTLRTPDLEILGPAAVEFQVAQPSGTEALKGTLQVAGAGRTEDKNSARQLGWWALNFAVCIGFLWLYSRRRKAAKD